VDIAAYTGLPSSFVTVKRGEEVDGWESIFLFWCEGDRKVNSLNPVYNNAVSGVYVTMLG
jgi:hypothetical protein